ncbi:MAG TPA: outer membrane beta-barrel protein [bacterium]|nr:outer membrane beta-barrel protein [bacterium]HPG84363.1 outer membrane beta-barrel protein [bacterium]
MKRGILVLVSFTLFILLNSAFAADKIVPQIRQGDKALLFTINGLGSFGVNGANAGLLVEENSGDVESSALYGLGFKTFISNRIALRVGLCYMGASVTTETDDGDEVESQSMLGLQPAIEYHLFQSEAVSIYTGGMISFSSYSAKSEVPDVDEVTFSSSSLGFGALLGAEFYPWKNVSFAAEYQLGFASGSGKYDDGTDEVEGPKASMKGINTVGVTIAFHFK